MSWFSRFPRAFSVAILCLAIGLAFGETFRGGFFMDDYFVLRAIHEGGGATQAVRDLTGNWVGFTGYSYYRPLVTASLAADLATFGRDATGFHWANLLLHALNAVLVLVLVRRAFPAAGWSGALAVSLLFAVNPVHPNAVGWIAARSDVLVCAFTLLAVLCYQRAWDSGRRRGLVQGLVWFACALASKESGVVVIALAAIVPGRAGLWTRVRGTLPGWLLLGAYFIWRLAVLDEGLGLHALGADVPLLERVSMLWSRLSDQFALVAFPAELRGTPWQWLALAVAVLATIGVLIRRGGRAVLFGAVVVLLGLAPILPIIHNLDTRMLVGFSRYWYVPVIGMALPAAFAVALGARWRLVPFAACVALVVAFVLVSRQRSAAMVQPPLIATSLANALADASVNDDIDTINIVLIAGDDRYGGVLVNRLAFTSAAIAPFIPNNPPLYPLALASAAEVIRRVGGHVPIRVFAVGPDGTPRVLAALPRQPRWTHKTDDGPFRLTPGIALDIDAGGRSPLSFDLLRVHGAVGTGQLRVSAEVRAADGLHRVFRVTSAVSDRTEAVDFDFRSQAGFLQAVALLTLRIEVIPDPTPERHPTPVDEELMIDGVTIMDRPAQATLRTPERGATLAVADGPTKLRVNDGVPATLSVRYLTAFGIRPPLTKPPLKLSDPMPPSLWRELVVGANFGSGWVTVLPVPGEGRDVTRYEPGVFRLR